MQLDSQKFWEFHRKLLLTARPHRQAAGAGGGEGRRRRYGPTREGHVKPAETKAALKEVAALADELRFDGTPAWVIGKEAILGGVPYAQLKAKIENMRKCGKTVC